MGGEGSVTLAKLARGTRAIVGPVTVSESDSSKMKRDTGRGRQFTCHVLRDKFTALSE